MSKGCHVKPSDFFQAKLQLIMLSLHNKWASFPFQKNKYCINPQQGSCLLLQSCTSYDLDLIWGVGTSNLLHKHSQIKGATPDCLDKGGEYVVTEHGKNLSHGLISMIISLFFIFKTKNFDLARKNNFQITSHNFYQWKFFHCFLEEVKSVYKTNVFQIVTSHSCMFNENNLSAFLQRLKTQALHVWYFLG